jgi:hypothetical protein
MRTVLLLFIALCATAGTAEATTLQVTSGFVFIQEPFMEPDVLIAGDGWSLHGFSGSSFIAISGTLQFHATTLTLDGNTFSGPQCCDNNSSISFALDLSTIPALTIWAVYPIVRPFTMTGHIGLAGGVDLAGQGGLIITRYNNPPNSDFSYLRYRYEFAPQAAVAETSSVLLLGIGLLLMSALSLVVRP